MIYRWGLILIILTLFQATEKKSYIVILGIAQDAGYPQAGCDKDCCKKYWEKKLPKQKVSCLALFDPGTNQKWIFDATPDFTEQLQAADKIQPGNLSGIFITHAHIGHYTGLIYLGREVMNAKEIPVYVMPRMAHFIQNNGPWSQLVSLKNINLQILKADSVVQLTGNISVTAISVPHRDEFSETVGYSIRTGNKSVLFVPDIDKWQKWEKDIKEIIKQYDYLFLDGTFYKNGELPGRSMNEVPHPFIEESLSLFNELTTAEKEKIWFIHFNHTNPLLDESSTEYKEVKNRGFKIASEGTRIFL
jgi:pyrroloquinoline quinone biosynthesis protein B